MISLFCLFCTFLFSFSPSLSLSHFPPFSPSLPSPTPYLPPSLPPSLSPSLPPSLPPSPPPSLSLPLLHSLPSLSLSPPFSPLCPSAGPAKAPVLGSGFHTSLGKESRAQTLSNGKFQHTHTITIIITIT